MGAGPAGSSCAIALLELGCQVTIIDSGWANKFHIGENVSPDINPVLKSLGVYDEFLKIKKSHCFGTCSYWGSDLRGYNDSILSPYGHGWHLDRREFDQYLVNMAKRKGAKLETNSTFKEVTIAAKGVSVIYQNSSERSAHLQGDFIVDASGSRGVVSKYLGINKINDTPLICLAQRFIIEKEGKMVNMTHLESVEHGWWYVAPIPDNTLLVSFYTTADVARNLKLNHHDRWISHLKKAPRTSEIALALKPLDARILGYSTNPFCLERAGGNRWVAIGDAASTYDPIMANGILKSIVQGMNVSSAIYKCVTSFDHGRLMGFDNQVKQEYVDYIRMRKQFYNLERRWPDSIFWKNMRGIKKSVSV